MTASTGTWAVKVGLAQMIPAWQPGGLAMVG